jgi:hypothetical protein
MNNEPVRLGQGGRKQLALLARGRPAEYDSGVVGGSSFPKASSRRYDVVLNRSQALLRHWDDGRMGFRLAAHLDVIPTCQASWTEIQTRSAQLFSGFESGKKLGKPFRLNTAHGLVLNGETLRVRMSREYTHER